MDTQWRYVTSVRRRWSQHETPPPHTYTLKKTQTWCSITPGDWDHSETVYIPFCGISVVRRASTIRRRVCARVSASDFRQRDRGGDLAHLEKSAAPRDAATSDWKQWRALQPGRGAPGSHTAPAVTHSVPGRSGWVHHFSAQRGRESSGVLCECWLLPRVLSIFFFFKKASRNLGDFCWSAPNF